MTKDEALKMAIEAMKQADKQLREYWDADIKRGYYIEEMNESPMLLCRDTIQDLEKTLAQPAQEPVNDDEITKALDFLNAVPNGYSFQPIDQERFERYVAMIAKQIEWLQSICADYAERAVKDGEQKIKDVQSIKKLFTHPAPSWQGLSDDEIGLLFDSVMANDTESTEFFGIEFARAIEQALKEKNT